MCSDTRLESVISGFSWHVPDLCRHPGYLLVPRETGLTVGGKPLSYPEEIGSPMLDEHDRPPMTLSACSIDDCIVLDLLDLDKTAIARPQNAAKARDHSG